MCVTWGEVEQIARVDRAIEVRRLMVYIIYSMVDADSGGGRRYFYPTFIPLNLRRCPQKGRLIRRYTLGTILPCCGGSYMKVIIQLPYASFTPLQPASKLFRLNVDKICLRSQIYIFRGSSSKKDLQELCPSSGLNICLNILDINPC